MNEIQRFKKDRMILKGGNGLDTGTLDNRPVTKINGIWVYDDTSTPVAGKSSRRIKINKPEPDPVTSQQPRNAALMHSYMDALRARYHITSSNYRDDVVGKPAQDTQPDLIAKPDATVKRTPINWNQKYQDFLGRMTDDLKAWLAQRGIDYTSAQKMQEYLTRVGKNVGKFGADNKWGNDSLAAWDDLVNTTMKNNPLLTPIKDVPKKVEPVVDAPDPFGYKTSNTYENGDFANKLRGMGIRSNADLINFMYKTGGKDYNWNGDTWAQQFRSDVDRALGGDYSDANIRKVFNTKNGWGRGSRGDFGDFQNALQTNAGIWNSRYDTKLVNARMDAARKQLAVTLSLQYSPQLTKPSPVKSVEPNKYAVSSSGASTLGTAGAGTIKSNKTWMESAAESGYLPKYQVEPLKLDANWAATAAQYGYLPTT